MSPEIPEGSIQTPQGRTLELPPAMPLINGFYRLFAVAFGFDQHLVMTFEERIFFKVSLQNLVLNDELRSI